ncbi:MAG: hypothetical protein L6Q38_05205, partial [Nitrospira sp.]|nr:hypothetical protein [Nitrospira sp.]
MPNGAPRRGLRDKPGYGGGQYDDQRGFHGEPSDKLAPGGQVDIHRALRLAARMSFSSSSSSARLTSRV